MLKSKNTISRYHDEVIDKAIQVQETKQPAVLTVINGEPIFMVTQSMWSEKAKLREALVQHGQHDDDCASNYFMPYQPRQGPRFYECDCGYGKALQESGGD